MGIFTKAKEYMPHPRFRIILLVVVFALAFSQIVFLNAYEAHVINFTATLTNGEPIIIPDGCQFCDIDPVEITLETKNPEVMILYTLDGTDPECGSHGDEYMSPFQITESTMVKARGCLDESQSRIVERFFEVSPEYCNGGCEIRTCTQTQGGWSQCCNGENVGCLRDDNWDTIIGTSLWVGQTNSLVFVGPSSLTCYLPAGGKPRVLTQIYINPCRTESGVFGGQITALKMNVEFSDAGVGLVDLVNPDRLGNLTITQGKFAGIDVYTLLALAEEVLGGATSGLEIYDASLGDLNDAVTQVNESFVDCVQKSNFLTKTDCSESYCGDGELDPGEECDDDNNYNNDGCSSQCKLELCQDNFNIGKTADEARLDGGKKVTKKVSKSDNKYAKQSVEGTKYITLDWFFEDIPDSANIVSTALTLEHQEHGITMSIEWWNGSEWLEVCDPTEATVDTVDVCDLSTHIDTSSEAQDIQLRLKLVEIENCTEKLDWANIEISYEVPIVCEESVVVKSLALEDEKENSEEEEGQTSKCSFDNIDLCIDEPTCIEIQGHWYDDKCNATATSGEDIIIDSTEEDNIVPTCDPEHLDLCLDEITCVEVQGYWYDELCNREPPEEEIICDFEHLDLCSDQDECKNAKGYWYDDECHATTRSDREGLRPERSESREAVDNCDIYNLNLCTTEELCLEANGYWYDEICNSDKEIILENNNDISEDSELSE